VIWLGRVRVRLRVRVRVRRSGRVKKTENGGGFGYWMLRLGFRLWGQS
jgi:hypothetical protein